MQQSIFNQSMDLAGQAFLKRSMIERMQSMSSGLGGSKLPMPKLPQASKRKRKQQRKGNFSSGSAAEYQYPAGTQQMHQFCCPPRQILPFCGPPQQILPFCGQSQRILPFCPPGPPLAYECNEYLLSCQNVSSLQNQVLPNPMAHPSFVHQRDLNFTGTTKTRKRKKTKRSEQFAKNSSWKYTRNLKNKKKKIGNGISLLCDKGNDDEMQSTIISEINPAESNETDFGASNDSDQYYSNFSDPEKLIDVIRESYARESRLGENEDCQFKLCEKARLHLVRFLFETECPTLDLAIEENQQEDQLEKLKKLQALKAAKLQFQDKVEEKLKKLVSEKLKFHGDLEEELNELV